MSSTKASTTPLLAATAIADQTPATRPAGFTGTQWSVAFALGLIACAVLMARAGLSVDPWSRSNIPYYLAALLAAGAKLGAAHVRWRHARALGEVAEFYAMFTGMALLGAVTSYPLAALTHGYADASLQRVDEALHFDWLAWYRTVAAHPSLQLLGQLAYENIYLTPAVLLGWFAWTGQRRDAHRFLAGFWLAAALTLALFSLMPAVGPFSYLWHAPIPYMPVSELWQPNLIPALRAHQVHVVDLGELRGIVSAPSFHTAAATLYLVTAWHVRPLRWPLVAANCAMLLSTPVEGTHYLADMILGAITALVAMTAVQLVLPRLPAPARPD